MMGFSRPFGPVFACCGALGIAVAGTFVVGNARETSAVAMPPVFVSALPPLPSPDSLAALLVSSSRGSHSTRGETALLLEALRVIDWIPSRHERADLLGELAELPHLDPAVVAEVGYAAGRISSPSARAGVLRALIRNHPAATAEARRPILDAIATMQSTPERAVTLEMFVTRHRLETDALIEALVQVDRLRADNERARILVAAASAQRLDRRARSAYISVARGIQNERYRARAMDAVRRD